MGPAVLHRGDTIRVRGERWTVAGHFRYPDASVVDVYGGEAANRGVRTRFLLPFETFEHLPRGRDLCVVSPRRWRHRARRVLADAVPSGWALRCLARADIDLLPFQLEPALAVTRGLAVRLLIADEVGLGKTVQAGLIVREVLDRQPTARALVVTPASLRDQWRAELSARFGLDAPLLDAATAARAPAGTNPWAVPLGITSMDYLKRPEVLRALEALVWDIVVIDEAHHLAGRSDRSAAAALVGERARTLVMLTATPHNGDDGAFARLSGIGDIDRQFPLLVFRRTRRHTRRGAARRVVWLRVTPTMAEQAMHRALGEYARTVWRHTAAAAGPRAAAAQLAMTVLARRACSSAASLVRSVERRIALVGAREDSESQQALPFGPGDAGDGEPSSELAAPGLADGADERRRLEIVLQLARRAQADESKLRAVARLLRRTREPVIVFTEYRDTLRDVAGTLLNHRAVQLHGGLSASERHAVLRQFTSGEADVLLTTDAAGEGLNLQQRCRLVVNLELPWSPARLEQRIGRVDRIGQARRVHQVHLLAARTDEELTVAPFVRRRSASVARTLDALRTVAVILKDHAAPDLEVAAALFDGSRKAHPRSRDAEGPDSAPTVLPDGVFVAALTPEANAEAARAAVSRSLLAPGLAGDASPVRPFVTAVRSRPSRACWAFRQEFGDADDEIFWDTVFGISHRMVGRLRRASDVRDVATRIHRALAHVVGEQENALRAEVTALARPALTLAIGRERGIIRALERRQARLAAALTQPGLFGGRGGRDAAGQHEVLSQVLSRCREQLARLERRQRVAGRRAEPLFAVFGW